MGTTDEVEEERELQAPREVDPVVPDYCCSLLNHIRHGTAFSIQSELRPCFQILKHTRLEFHYKPKEFPTHVLVTPDFMRTIKSVNDSTQDDFLRPLRWALKCKGFKWPVIISSHEANMFLPSVQGSSHATLYMYMARTSRGMVPFDAFDIVKIPSHNESGVIDPQATALLNLFAGQLYFSSFEHYKDMCTLIGLYDGERCLSHKRNVANDNFVSLQCREANGWRECTFKTSPVGWIKSFIDMRRLGIEWSHTHMGRILGGQILRRDEFGDREAKSEDVLAKATSELTIGDKDE